MCKITSLFEYFKWIRLEKSVNEFAQDIVHYRGQGNSSWGLTPSVFRSIGRDRFYNERKLILDAQVQCWRWLQDCQSELDQLVKLQHFGLKTRLLDFTSNPLIALYFACCSEENSDGVVYCSFKNFSDISIAKLIVKIITNHDNSEVEILDDRLLHYAKIVGINMSNSNLLKQELSKSHIILCPYNNERIANQNGLFAIAPLFDKNTYSFFCPHEINLSMPKYGLEVTKKAIIKSTSKSRILQDLAQIGISEKYIFPDFEHTLISINKNQAIGNVWEIDI